MQKLLLEASEALSRNDADALERLCAVAASLRTVTPAVLANVLRETEADALAGAPPPEPSRPGLDGAGERDMYARALLCFQRQVSAARSNLTMRERLLALHTAGAVPWAR